MKYFKIIWLTLKTIFWKVSLEEVCDFSAKYFDIHDYPVNRGGDGIPEHFRTYTCHNCGKDYEL